MVVYFCSILSFADWRFHNCWWSMGLGPLYRKVICRRGLVEELNWNLVIVLSLIVVRTINPEAFCFLKWSTFAVGIELLDHGQHWRGRGQRKLPPGSASNVGTSTMRCLVRRMFCPGNTWIAGLSWQLPSCWRKAYECRRSYSKRKCEGIGTTGTAVARASPIPLLTLTGGLLAWMLGGSGMFFAGCWLHY